MRMILVASVMLGLTLTLQQSTAGEAEAESRRCSLAAFSPWRRVDSIAYVVLKGTQDSVFDAVYYDGRGGASRKSDHDAKPILVYGQVADIVKVEKGSPSEVRGFPKAVLIWWVHDAACFRMAPQKAVRLKPGEEVFVAIAPRPRYDWIRGAPTYDADYRNELYFGIYSPWLAPPISSDPPGSIPKMLNAKQYGEFYERLPAQRKPELIKKDFWALSMWVKNHPELAKKQPLAEVIDRVNQLRN